MTTECAHTYTHYHVKSALPVCRGRCTTRAFDSWLTSDLLSVWLLCSGGTSFSLQGRHWLDQQYTLVCILSEFDKYATEMVSPCLNCKACDANHCPSRSAQTRSVMRASI